MTTSALHGAQPRFSCETKGKALISAINEAGVASLSAAKAFRCKARFEASSYANSEATLLKGKKVLHNAKALSAQIASPHGELY